MIHVYAYLSLERDDVDNFYVIHGYRSWEGRPLWWELRDLRDENAALYKDKGSVVGIHYKLFTNKKWEASFLGLPNMDFRIHCLTEAIATIGCRIAAELFPSASEAS